MNQSLIINMFYVQNVQIEIKFNMNKEEAIQELQDLLNYWKYIKMYDNKAEQDAVQFAIDYMKEN